jgi:phosphoglycerate dehydrogenase-like enzyme
MKLAILDDYQRVSRRFADWSALEQRCSVTVFDRNLGGPDAAAAALHDFEIICAMRERQPFPRAMFEHLPNLRLLVTTGMRNLSIDLSAASDHGVVVCGTGGEYSLRSTAELAWGLMLGAMRHLAEEDRGMRSGGWQTTIGRTLTRKTLGIIGLGRIGAQIAAYGNAFGMTVLAWSQNLTPERAQAAGAERVEMDELLRRSDIVSLHVILSDRTRGMIGEREIALLKPGALLVNTSRGPLIDTEALVRALRAERISAAIDVYDEEPLPKTHPLRSAPNVLLSPHIGYVTEEVYAEFYRDSVEDVTAFLGREPVRVLNPDVLAAR